MKPNDVVTQTISEWSEVKVLKDFSRKLQFNGKSHVYKDRVLRKRNLDRNQLTGQAGEAAACKALYTFDKYIEKSEQIVPKGCGDDGNDIVGAYLPIDVKTTCVELEDLTKIFYTKDLLVTEQEFSPNAIYVACMLNRPPTYMDLSFTVHVMGWCWGREMDWVGDKENRGRERVPGFRKMFKHLTPIHKMNWNSLLETERTA